MGKPTDKNIAAYFHTTTRTLGRWKKDKELVKRYDALKEYFIINTMPTQSDKIRYHMDKIIKAKETE